MYNQGTTQSPGKCSFSTGILIDMWQAVISEQNIFTVFIVKHSQSCLCPVLHFSDCALSPTLFICCRSTGVNGFKLLEVILTISLAQCELVLILE